MRGQGILDRPDTGAVFAAIARTGSSCSRAALVALAQGDHRHTGAQQRRQTSGDPARIPGILQLRGQMVDQRGAVQCFAQEQKPGIVGEFLGPRLHPDGPVAQRAEKL